MPRVLTPSEHELVQILIRRALQREKEHRREEEKREDLSSTVSTPAPSRVLIDAE